ncbi:hypothetical protein BDR26DRAFT_902716 [Obelidium mucronatum]|nr:hypothetical protein BDR26DRAFT_902716 [Obelidium mucronatum]
MRVINLCSWTGVADGIKDPHYPAVVASVKVKEHAKKVANRLAVFGKENIKPELLPHFEGLQALWSLWYIGRRLRWWLTLQRKLQPHVIPSLGSSRPRFLRAQTMGASSSTWTARIQPLGLTSLLWWMRKTRNCLGMASGVPDQNVVIPAVHGEAIVSMFKHEKHGTRMWLAFRRATICGGRGVGSGGRY